MSLQLVFGNSGSGKSYEIYHRIVAESLENRENNYIVLVPEQFTMQTQKDLVDIHPNHALLNIDILSFQRLSYRIFDEVGMEMGIILDDTGKKLALRKIVQEKEENFRVLKGNLKRIGYLDEVKSMISEFAQYDISPEGLDSFLQEKEMNFVLKEKMKDIHLLYESFRQFMEEKYVIAEDILSRLEEAVEKSEVLKNSVIILDSFTGFTPLQNKVLRKLLKHCKKVIVTVTIDTMEDFYKPGLQHHLFALSKKTVYKLVELAKELGVEKEADVIIPLDENHRGKRFLGSQALGWMEQNLFRYKKEEFTEETQDIQIFESGMPKEEVHFAARKIHFLIKEKGLRFQEIGVITGDIATYGTYIREIFPSYDIPVFLDDKKSVLHHPAIELLRSIMEISLQKFSYESVMRYFRTGLTGFPVQDIDKIENYILLFGIRGEKQWREPWTRTTGKLSPDELDRLNEIRSHFFDEIIETIQVLKSKKSTVRAVTEAIYSFLVIKQLPQQLLEKSEKLKSRLLLDLSKEYSQIYQVILDIFDKLVELLGESTISLKEYKELIEAAADEAKIGIIPPGKDWVLAGDIERTRLNHIKALFILGVNDGIIPQSGNQGGIISTLEREILEANGLELAPSVQEKSFIQKFYLYQNMTKPSNHLFLSYSMVDSAGKAIRPSYLIQTMKKLFPKIAIEQIDLFSLAFEDRITAKSTIESLVKHLSFYYKGELSKEALELYQWFSLQAEWKKIIQQITSGIDPVRVEDSISKSVVNGIYGTQLEGSVTRLEQFASCSFAHFLKYGIRLQERKLYTFEAMDLGTVFHEILLVYAKNIESRGFDWFTITKEHQEEILSDSIEYVLLNSNTALYSTARNTYFVQRIRRFMERTIWVLSEQLRRGTFTPELFEVPFVKKEGNINLKGRIDRIDTYEDESNLYVKVIDYKSGKAEFDLLSVYFGLQLQLVLYLNMAVDMKKKELEESGKSEKNVVPAAALYYHIDDPVIDKKEESEEETKDRLLKKFVMGGVYEDNLTTLQLMDGKDGQEPLSLPYKVKKDGSLGKSKGMYNGEEMKMLSSYVNQKIEELGKEILEGNISLNPYTYKKRSSCTFCEYSVVCGIDPEIDKSRYRQMDCYLKDNIWEKIYKETKR